MPGHTRQPQTRARAPPPPDLTPGAVDRKKFVDGDFAPPADSYQVTRQQRARRGGGRAQLLLPAAALLPASPSPPTSPADWRPPHFPLPRRSQDTPLPIGYAQTISAPHMHAICLELLQGHLVPVRGDPATAGAGVVLSQLLTGPCQHVRSHIITNRHTLTHKPTHTLESCHTHTQCPHKYSANTHARGRALWTLAAAAGTWRLPWL